MHPSQSFLTEARTFIPRICVGSDVVVAPNIRGTGSLELRVFGMEVKERVAVAAVNRSSPPPRALVVAKNIARSNGVLRPGWGCCRGEGEVR
jgi:hypothetical protein